jgi:hypothetical protein
VHERPDEILQEVTVGAQSKARLVRRQLRLVGQKATTTEKDRLPPWTPFERATPVLSPEKRLALIHDMIDTVRRTKSLELTQEAAEAFVDEKQDAEMYQNSRYTVLVFRNEPSWHEGAVETIHLSIRRNDRECPREERWRDFQRIKNELVGPEYEAAELYPAEDRVVDLASQFHLYVLKDAESEFPFGFRDGMRAGPRAGSPASQRPFEDE